MAKALNIPRVDLDEEIEKHFNMSVNEIFQKYGEEKFREVENELFLKYIKQKGCVLSLGGGTLHHAENVDELLNNSIVFFLNRNVNLLKKNKKAAGDREARFSGSLHCARCGSVIFWRIHQDRHDSLDQFNAYTRSAWRGALRSVRRSLARCGFRRSILFNCGCGILARPQHSRNDNHGYDQGNSCRTSRRPCLQGA